jgi:hypothetical protein
MLSGVVFCAAAGEPVPPAPDNLSDFNDAEAGYSFKIPAGYTRISQETIREAFKSISETLAKDASARTRKFPPAYFKGPIDPDHPKLPPPAMAIGYTELAESIDPEMIAKYKEQLEANARKEGENTLNLQLELIHVNGILSLRTEYDKYSPIDNTRMRQVDISVPGHQCRYDIIFTYNSEQAPRLKDAIDTMTRTFTVAEAASPGGANRWVRVALYTVGGLVLGLLIGFIFGAIAGNKNPEPAEGR